MENTLKIRALRLIQQLEQRYRRQQLFCPHAAILNGEWPIRTCFGDDPTIPPDEPRLGDVGIEPSGRARDTMRRVKKRYDRAYFEKWYRGPGSISTAAEVRRKVTMAVAIAEFFLRRSIRSVLDVGCGEGVWFEHLRALRPRVSYAGIEASDYAVATFGRARNIHRGSVGELTALDTSRRYDLVTCADVLHYVSDADVRHGIAAMSSLSKGLVYLEVLTAEDDIIGDLQEFKRRPARFYRQICARHGLSFVGPYCWLSPDLRDSMAEMEGGG